MDVVVSSAVPADEDEVLEARDRGARGHPPGGASGRDGGRAAVDLRRRRPRQDDDHGDDRLRRARASGSIPHGWSAATCRSSEGTPGPAAASCWSPRPTSRTARARCCGRGSRSSRNIELDHHARFGSEQRAARGCSPSGSRASRPDGAVLLGDGVDLDAVAPRSLVRVRRARRLAGHGVRGERRRLAVLAARAVGAAAPRGARAARRAQRPERRRRRSRRCVAGRRRARPMPPRPSREFEGAGRRFELRGSVGGVEIVDDYAHHPTEVAAAIDAARAQSPAARRGLLPAAPVLAHRGAGEPVRRARWRPPTRWS